MNLGVGSPTAHPVEIIFPTSIAKHLVKLELHLVPFFCKLYLSLVISVTIFKASFDSSNLEGLLTPSRQTHSHEP